MSLNIIIFSINCTLSLFFQFVQQTGPDDEEDEEEAMNEIERRNHMLEQLLTLLNSAAAMGLGPDPGELGKQFQDTLQNLKAGLRKG
jgi:hypothetical protein